MAATEKDQAFVEYIVKQLVDNPDKVTITRTVDERGVLLELGVDPSDMGKIIGKSGATAKSIRTLLRVLGAKDDARYNLKINEPEGSERTTRTETTKDSSETQEAQDIEQSKEVDEPDTSLEDIKAKARKGIEDLDTDI